jgi:hypothetical protein
MNYMLVVKNNKHPTRNFQYSEWGRLVHPSRYDLRFRIEEAIQITKYQVPKIPTSFLILCFSALVASLLSKILEYGIIYRVF